MGRRSKRTGVGKCHECGPDAYLRAPQATRKEANTTHLREAEAAEEPPLLPLCGDMPALGPARQPAPALAGVLSEP